MRTPSSFIAVVLTMVSGASAADCAAPSANTTKSCSECSCHQTCVVRCCRVPRVRRCSEPPAAVVNYSVPVMHTYAAPLYAAPLYAAPTYAGTPYAAPLYAAPVYQANVNPTPQAASLQASADCSGGTGNDIALLRRDLNDLAKRVDGLIQVVEKMHSSK